MARALPSSLPPSHLQGRALEALIARLSPQDTDTATLQHALALTARHSLQLSSSSAPLPSTRPLQVMLSLPPALLNTGMLFNAIVAYPNHLAAVTTLSTRILSVQPETTETIRTEILPDLITRLRLSSSPFDLAIVVRILLSLVRAHEEFLGLLLTEADYVLPALRDAYPKLTFLGGTAKDIKVTIAARADVLMFCHALLAVMSGQSKEALKRLMGDGAGSSKRVLVDGSLRNDYEAVYERMQGIKEEQFVVLEGLREDEVAADRRLAPLINLFPHIPAPALLSAVEHPTFASPLWYSIPDEAAEPVVEAILSGGASLPDGLEELRAALDPATVMNSPETVMAHPTPRKKVERRNIFDGEDLDFSRLRLGKDDSSLPQLGSEIPDHLRASIMRLVESQAEEEREVERALREAHGVPSSASRSENGDEGGEEVEASAARVLKVSAGAEESGDESGDKIVSRRSSEGKLYDVDQQTKLELAYLSDPKIFDRDGQTRRSEARRKLKELTGMDDGQLEGWKVMLERNPHKDAILARHTFAPQKGYLGEGLGGQKQKPAGGRGGKGGGRGGRGGGSGGGGGGGSGSGGGGEGGGGRGGGGGGGRGRGSKGSRGHSNAARTRGHDKKMSRMGAGL